VQLRHRTGATFFVDLDNEAGYADFRRQGELRVMAASDALTGPVVAAGLARKRAEMRRLFMLMAG
jgi:hypothetical protein